MTASTPKWNSLAITRTEHNDTAANVEFGVESHKTYRKSEIEKERRRERDLCAPLCRVNIYIYMCYWANCTLWQVQTKRQMTWYMLLATLTDEISYCSCIFFFYWFAYISIDSYMDLFRIDFICSSSNSVIFFPFC